MTDEAKKEEATEAEAAEAKAAEETTEDAPIAVPEARSTVAGPFARLADIEREVERAFENVFDRGWLRPLRWDFPSLRPFGELPSLKEAFEGKTPKVNVIDRDDEVVIEAELPGVEKDDIEVSLAENGVTIKATTRREKEEEEEGQYHRREITRGYFSRTVPLPCAVDDSKAKAAFKDGILTLSAPKAEAAKGRKISVD